MHSDEPWAAYVPDGQIEISDRPVRLAMYPAGEMGQFPGVPTLGAYLPNAQSVHNVALLKELCSGLGKQAEARELVRL